MAQHSYIQLSPALKRPSSKTQGVKQKRDSESLTHRDISPSQASENKCRAPPSASQRDLTLGDGWLA